jgi:hypothetical protein
MVGKDKYMLVEKMTTVFKLKNPPSTAHSGFFTIT